ncbi:MAG: 3-keto-5-aminohexanoate cleavage protein [Sphingopyxis sp.]|nr:3-keto-5-aminohexanoate cleavage protein [Sphingopyxis sp.]
MNPGAKTIISCAVTGGSPFNRNHPNFPVTPKQIADEAIAAANAGAAIVHLHVRNPETGDGSRDPKLFVELCDRIRSANCDVLINLTGGTGAFFMPDEDNEGMAAAGSDVASVDERMEHLEQCRPDIASLDVNTSNQIEGTTEFVYLNTTRTLRAMAERYRQAGIKPELEVFSAGDIEFGKQLIVEGLIDGPPMFQFVLGVPWCAPADTLGIYYMRALLPHDSVWGALGIGRHEFPVVAQSLLLGGNVRVGLEDNLYLRKGVFASNADLVSQARDIIEALGNSVATTKDAAAMLDLKR